MGSVEDQSIPNDILTGQKDDVNGESEQTTQKETQKETQAASNVVADVQPVSTRSTSQVDLIDGGKLETPDREKVRDDVNEETPAHVKDDTPTLDDNQKTKSMDGVKGNGEQKPSVDDVKGKEDKQKVSITSSTDNNADKSDTKNPRSSGNEVNDVTEPEVASIPVIPPKQQDNTKGKPQKDEDTDSHGKDTDPLLSKSDSQKTLQSDAGSSIKSDSSTDTKKPATDGKKKYSYIPIVATGKEKAVEKDPKRKKSDGKVDTKAEKDSSNSSVRTSRSTLAGGTQNIAMKGKSDTSSSGGQGETTFSVVNEVKSNNAKNVKWKESDTQSKDKKVPTGAKKESKIPELDKSKQNVLQTTLKREHAVLSNGSIKTTEKENEQKTETPAIPEKVEVSEKPADDPSKKDGALKPKSILARAIMKKVKEGSGQGQGQDKALADPKHVVLSGPPAAVKTPSKTSLAVPSPVPRDPVDDKDDRLSLSSRRDSTKLSLSDSMSRKSIDIRVANATTVIIPSTGDEEKPKSLVSSNDSWIRSAIPFMPLSLAIGCLLLNIFLPGSGTILSGLSILCCGKARVPTKDDHVPITLCVNVWVGVAQLFTVTFLLVGWFWSVAWGIKMVILSIEYRKELKQKREKELQALALSAFGSPTRGRRSLFT